MSISVTVASGLVDGDGVKVTISHLCLCVCVQWNCGTDMSEKTTTKEKKNPEGFARLKFLLGNYIKK